LKIWLLLIAIFAISSHNSIAQPKFQIVLKNNNGTLDLCGNSFRKEVLLTVNLGLIESKDSLLGFNFKIKYDTNKVKFNTYLKSNTLSAFFNFADGRVSRTEQGLFASGGQINDLFVPIVGNKPLVAFAGEYIADCNDSTIIEVEYFEFNDEFTKKLDIDTPYVSLKVLGEIEKKPERKMVVNFTKDTIVIYADSLYEESFELTSMANSKSENVTVTFTKDSDKIRITDLVAQDSSAKVTVFLNDFALTLAEINNQQTGITKKFKMKLKSELDEDFVTKIYTKSEINVNCTCITEIFEDSVTVIVKKKQINSVVEDRNYYENLKKIDVYNYLGQRVKEVNSLIELNKMPNGIYLLEIISEDNTKRLQKLIINN